jgi:hypothetical protein
VYTERNSGNWYQQYRDTRAYGDQYKLTVSGAKDGTQITAGTPFYIEPVDPNLKDKAWSLWGVMAKIILRPPGGWDRFVFTGVTNSREYTLTDLDGSVLGGRYVDTAGLSTSLGLGYTPDHFQFERREG